MNGAGEVSLWVAVLTAVFAVLGAAFAAIGSFGLLRMPSFIRRVHTPTLGATAGVWCMTVATIAYFSAQGSNLYVHAILITGFIALTSPVTTLFLVRTALFRERQKGADLPSAGPPDPGD